ncbi:BAG domain-containing protein Samui-like [Pollicipes pollicipes]|uniref:BAG domain-containing protein Samui-like n=1 Tax=Pollicipes pollicipes TaxID=41117 RepID=UPI001884DF53|nr:BAG domain-containing protein Samui-like [Pollicipes pollicipes]
MAPAAAAQRDEAARPQHKPNYFNSSPKPFSSEPRPFQAAAAFGRGWPPAAEQIPIPVHVERGGDARRPPQTAPKPRPATAPQPKPQPQPEPEKERPPPPPPAKTPKERAMERIGTVRDEVAQLASQVDAFTGTKGEKQYIFLDEMLTRELIKLDDVETGGDDEVRTSRKDVIMSIQNCLGRLERQSSVAAAEQTAGEQPMETEQAADGTENAKAATTEAEAVMEAEVAEKPVAPPAEGAQPPAEGGQPPTEGKQPPVEVSQAPAADTAPQEAVQEATREAPQNTAQQASQETAQETPEEAVKESPQETRPGDGAAVENAPAAAPAAAAAAAAAEPETAAAAAATAATAAAATAETMDQS